MQNVLQMVCLLIGIQIFIKCLKEKILIWYQSVRQADFMAWPL